MAVTVGGDGAPGAIRTPDPQVRSLVLYPAESRVRKSELPHLRNALIHE